MTRVSDPTQIDHAVLREIAVQASWVAELEPWEEDPLEVALSVVQANYEEADQALEVRVTEWLAQDPEHWPIFRLVVLDPWQERPGQWREDAPRWVRRLGTNTALAHFQQDPYRRQRAVDFE